MVGSLIASKQVQNTFIFLCIILYTKHIADIPYWSIHVLFVCCLLFFFSGLHRPVGFHMQICFSLMMKRETLMTLADWVKLNYYHASQELLWRRVERKASIKWLMGTNLKKSQLLISEKQIMLCRERVCQMCGLSQQ